MARMSYVTWKKKVMAVMGMFDAQPRESRRRIDLLIQRKEFDAAESEWEELDPSELEQPVSGCYRCSWIDGKDETCTAECQYRDPVSDKTRDGGIATIERVGSRMLESANTENERLIRERQGHLDEIDRLRNSNFQLKRELSEALEEANNSGFFDEETLDLVRDLIVHWMSSDSDELKGAVQAMTDAIEKDPVLLKRVLAKMPAEILRLGKAMGEKDEDSGGAEGPPVQQ